MGRVNKVNGLVYIDYFGTEATKKTNEQIFAKALELIDWVNDEPKQTSVKTHLENMQKDIDDLPF